MKKRIPILILAMVLVFSLTACGSSEYAGEYKCTKVSMEVEGQEISADPGELFDGEVSVVLKNDETAVLTLSGEPAEGTWAVEGNNFTLSFEGSESKGTIKDKVLEIDLLGTGMKCTFEKAE